VFTAGKMSLMSSLSSADYSTHSENDSDFVDVESAYSTSSSSESSVAPADVLRSIKLSNSAMHSMQSTRSRANSVDVEVVTTFVESIERVATARRALENDTAPAAVPSAQKVKEATKGIENLKKEVEMVRGPGAAASPVF